MNRRINETIEDVYFQLDNAKSIVQCQVLRTRTTLEHIRQSTLKEGDIIALLTISSYVTRSFVDYMDKTMKEFYDQLPQKYLQLKEFIQSELRTIVDTKTLKYVIDQIDSKLTNVTPFIINITWRNRRLLTVLFNEVAGRVMNSFHTQSDAFKTHPNAVSKYESHHLTRITNDLINQLEIFIADVTSKIGAVIESLGLK